MCAMQEDKRFVLLNTESLLYSHSYSLMIVIDCSGYLCLSYFIFMLNPSVITLSFYLKKENY